MRRTGRGCGAVGAAGAAVTGFVAARLGHAVAAESIASHRELGLTAGGAGIDGEPDAFAAVGIGDRGMHPRLEGPAVGSIEDQDVVAVAQSHREGAVVQRQLSRVAVGFDEHSNRGEPLFKQIEYLR